MSQLLSSLKAIGLELSSSQRLKGAEIILKKNRPLILRLFDLPTTSSSHVKQLYMRHPLLTTGVEGLDVLIRPLRLPLKKEKDIAAALPFQAEPLLPYGADQAILSRQMLQQDQEGTDLTVLAIRKDHLQAHVERWSALGIEPEKVSSTQVALCRFGKAYIDASKAYLLLHMTATSTTCVLINQGKLIASFSQSEGLSLLEEVETRPASATLDVSHLSSDIFSRLQNRVAKMSYALSKEGRGISLAGLVVTGKAVKIKGLDEALAQAAHLPLLGLEQAEEGSAGQDKLDYAVPIGLALNALDPKESVDFRQQDLSYPHPWKRLKVPLALYFISMLALSVVFYFFGQLFLKYREDQLKQEYVSLLGGMQKSHEQFEETFLAKTPSAREKSQGEVVEIARLNRDDLLARLNFLQKDLQGTPDSFPLFANIPRVSDVLAWLSQHPAVAFQDEEGHPQARLQIENFSYTVLKRPMQGKKQEKYQVKVEVEFSSPTPKWAREFHDALIASNDWVDPKGEVKWSSNRGHYKTSFYLKDKTTYPSQ